MSSRWATSNDHGDAQVQTERKRQKEEKRRLKEEKQRKVEAERARIQEDLVIDGEDAERPSKRQRTQTQTQEGADLLDLPSSGFGPSRSLDIYEILNNIEEGSYGFVSRAKAKQSGDIVALKRLKVEHTNEGFPVTGLREIQTLRACVHPHIVKLREVVVGPGPAQE